MASLNDLSPEYLFIDGDPTTDEIRSLLTELGEVSISGRTGKLFAGLSLLPPAMRLSLNLGKLMDIMSQQDVTNVLDDGLMLDERSALLEMDVQGLTIESRTTARALLNMKERWITVKTLAGLFKSCRHTEGGYLQLDATFS